MPRLIPLGRTRKAAAAGGRAAGGRKGGGAGAAAGRRSGTGFGVPAFAHPLVAPAEWDELARPGAPLDWAAFDVSARPGHPPGPALRAGAGPRP